MEAKTSARFLIEGSDAEKSGGKGGEEMRKELEYVKKIALLAKLFRLELLTEKEYERIRRKLMDSYLIAGERSDDPRKAIA